jgi:hypothetical protein
LLLSVSGCTILSRSEDPNALSAEYGQSLEDSRERETDVDGREIQLGTRDYAAKHRTD